MRKLMNKLYLVILLLISLYFISGCQKQAETGITEEDAKAITDQILKIWNLGDLSVVDDLYAPGYIRHHPVPSAYASLDGFKSTVIANRTFFPDYSLAIQEIHVKGDRIIAFAKVTGTNTEPLEDRPATGKKIHMEGIYIYLISEGKIVEEWTYFNLLSYYEQLGFTLSPPQRSESKEEK
jgi:steroid delta-isomerase-like uncharacterized protein